MFHRKFVWPLLLVFGLMVVAYAADKQDSKKEEVRHVVCFKFKEGTTQEQIDKVVTAFEALEKKIPGITNFEWGTNNSSEGYNQDFTHCFILTFDSIKSRDEYLPHPDHKKFGETLGPVFGGVFVIDFVVQ